MDASSCSDTAMPPLHSCAFHVRPAGLQPCMAHGWLQAHGDHLHHKQTLWAKERLLGSPASSCMQKKRLRWSQAAEDAVWSTSQRPGLATRFRWGQSVEQKKGKTCFQWQKNATIWWQMWTELTYSSCSQLLKRLSIAAAAHAPGFAGQRQVQNFQMLPLFVLWKPKVRRFSMNQGFLKCCLETKEGPLILSTVWKKSH